MSRSYKKNPYVTDNSKGRKGHGRPMKAYAAKKVRHYKDMPTTGSRSFYKKVFCSYEICDYKWRLTKEQAILDWHEEEKEYPCWHSYYIHKPSKGESYVDEYGVLHVSSYERVLEEEYIEVGPLHKKYGTLENYLGKYWKKRYYRK